MKARFDKSFRAVLFRMVSKRLPELRGYRFCFRAVLFRMVSKPDTKKTRLSLGFRAVLFRMVLKYTYDIFGNVF